MTAFFRSPALGTWKEESGAVDRDEIVVCRMTSPAWVVLFTKISGLVTDAGGVKDVASLGGKRVAVIPGTTTEKSLAEAMRKTAVSGSQRMVCTPARTDASSPESCWTNGDRPSR